MEEQRKAAEKGELANRKRYTYEDFLEIIRILRGEDGCPWDREQTHLSLRSCLMEEAAEVLAAIRIYDRTGSFENLREELGDVLLQVVMHAEIAKEEGLFDMADVVSEVAEKMVRRHPHVFGHVTAQNSDQVLENWEEIKKKEKGENNQGLSPLEEIPGELPSLTRAVKVLKKADKLYSAGIDTSCAAAALRRAADLLEEGHGKCDKGEMTEQIGDILMTVSDLSRIYKLSPEEILTDRIEEFIEDIISLPNG